MMAGLESWPDSRDQRATCSAVSVALIVLAIEFSVATCQGKTSKVAKVGGFRRRGFRTPSAAPLSACSYTKELLLTMSVLA